MPSRQGEPVNWGTDRGSLGRAGEEMACLFFQACGYVCLARRFRKREGEIDLVMRRGPLVVFVEVKTRRSDSYGAPEQSVTRGKVARLRFLARRFLHEQKLEAVQEFRFDVVAVDFRGEGRGCRLRHLAGVS